MNLNKKDLTALIKYHDETSRENARLGIKDILKQHILNVVFTKRDGTIRKMDCTLRENYLPIQETPYTGYSKPDNLDTVAVWDVKNEAWRSFRLDSVISITLID